ncbi:MAG: Uma2 family endonuclease, partial [Acidobacteriaceae bacterium]|nr:Uma2 family endonuclease [Acidobacteriaceae bacterium]
QLRAWALRKKHGEAFGPTTTFKFPNRALREPDAAWASNERVYGIPYQQRVERIPIVPEFVIEIFSKTDRYDQLQEKMDWYIRNGVELGWLIHPKLREVLTYTPVEKSKLKNVDKIRGTGPVKGFVLDLRPIWRGLRREGE